MIVLDIETVALPDAAQWIEPASPPAHYKDPAKIAAYLEAARAKDVEQAALDPDLCQIVAIGWREMDEAESDGHILLGGEEHWVLDQIMTVCRGYERLCGFNLLGFDLPVLARRALYLGLPVPALWGDVDRFRTRHEDLMERLSHRGRFKTRSLQWYCRRFGITGPPDPYTGQDIGRLVATGEWGAVRAHCLADVRKTAALARRLGVT